MKNKTNRRLLLTLLVSLASYAGIVFAFSRLDRPTLFICTLFLHAVPMYCFQLLLCRRARLWIALLPTLFLGGAMLVAIFNTETVTGWDGIFWEYLTLYLAAPAIGCALAWLSFSAGDRNGGGGQSV